MLGVGLHFDTPTSATLTQDPGKVKEPKRAGEEDSTADALRGQNLVCYKHTPTMW